MGRIVEKSLFPEDLGHEGRIAIKQALRSCVQHTILTPGVHTTSRKGGRGAGGS